MLPQETGELEEATEKAHGVRPWVRVDQTVSHEVEGPSVGTIPPGSKHENDLPRPSQALEMASRTADVKAG